MGELNFILEELIDNLAEVEKLQMDSILKLFAIELKHYPDAQEEYEDGSRPKFYLIDENGDAYEYKIAIRKNSKINNKKTIQKFKRLIKYYVQKQDLQWGEILYTVYGYICIHRPDIKNYDFFYGEY